MKKALITILSLSHLLSCQDLEVPSLDSPQIVTVEGWLSDEVTHQKIRLSYSSSFGDELLSTPITNATISIKRIGLNSQEYLFGHTNAGVYLSQTLFGGQENTWYQLQIVLENGDEMVSTIEAINALSEIDSLFYGNYTRENPEINGETEVVYYPIVRTKDSTDLQNFYRWKASRNDTLLTDPEDMSVLSDQFFDGNQIDNELTSFEYRVGDLISIEQQQISREAFDFLELIKQQTTLLGTVNSTSPAQIRGNISYLNKNESILGYWGVISIDTQTIIIE